MNECLVMLQQLLSVGYACATGAVEQRGTRGVDDVPPRQRQPPACKRDRIAALQ